jgi:nucleotide-binding universal stress UspA family protein
VLLVVSDPEWAAPLLRWVSHLRLHGAWSRLVVCVPDREVLEGTRLATAQLSLGPCEFEVVEGVARSGESISARTRPCRGVLPVVGPLPCPVLARLVLGAGSQADPGGAGPIVVVPASSWGTEPADQHPLTITAGFHGSRSARAALSWAVDEAERGEGQVTAVMAWLDGDFASVGGSVPMDRSRHLFVGPAARRLAESSLLESGLPVARVRSMARMGSPGRVLVDQAGSSDVLVVGAGQTIVHSHPVLGAVTLGCVARSPVPVVIVPAPVRTTRRGPLMSLSA